MELKGIRVRHKTFGEGAIKELREDYVLVAFPQGEKKFNYPDAYGAYFSAVEPEGDARIRAHISALETKKTAVEQAEKRRKFMQRMREMHEERS